MLIETRFLRIVLMAGFLLGTVFRLEVFGQTTKPMTNEDVIQMVSAGFDDDMVIKTIQSRPAAFDTSVEKLISLKKAGLSQKIIAAMISPVATAKAPAAEQQSNIPEEVGVYVRQGEKFLLVEPEAIALRTSGFPMFGRNFNGSLSGPSSSARIAMPAEVVIHCADGTSATDYQLLKLEVKKDHREFRAMRAGAFGRTKAGGEDNVIAVEFRKLGPRTYSAALDKLAPGEYGWLPPGSADMSKLMGGSGRIHTFRVPD